MRLYPFWGQQRHEGRALHEHEEFLWTGMRARLEGAGRARPGTLRLEAVGQLSERRHPEVFFHPIRPALRNHLQAAQPARVS